MYPIITTLVSYHFASTGSILLRALHLVGKTTVAVAATLLCERARRLLRGLSEVSVVVLVVPRALDDNGRRAERAAGGGLVGVEVVGGDGVAGAAEDALAETQAGELAERPADVGLGGFGVAAEGEGSDGVQTLVDVAQYGGGVEVGGAELADGHADRVLKQGVSISRTSCLTTDRYLPLGRYE